MSSSLLLLEFPDNKSELLGDCSISGFEGHISVNSFKWDVSAETDEDERDALTACAIGNLHITKDYDRSSLMMCNLMNADRNRAKPFNFTTAMLRLVDPADAATFSGGSKFDSRERVIMEIELTNGQIEEITVQASQESDRFISLTENIELSFEGVKLSYRAFDAKSKSRKTLYTFAYKHATKR